MAGWPRAGTVRAERTAVGCTLWMEMSVDAIGQVGPAKGLGRSVEEAKLSRGWRLRNSCKPTLAAGLQAGADARMNNQPSPLPI
jgi:hypothetical protein